MSESPVELALYGRIIEQFVATNIRKSLFIDLMATRGTELIVFFDVVCSKDFLSLPIMRD